MCFQNSFFLRCRTAGGNSVGAPGYLFLKPSLQLRCCSIFLNHGYSCSFRRVSHGTTETSELALVAPRIASTYDKDRINTGQPGPHTAIQISDCLVIIYVPPPNTQLTTWFHIGRRCGLSSLFHECFWYKSTLQKLKQVQSSERRIFSQLLVSYMINYYYLDCSNSSHFQLWVPRAVFQNGEARYTVSASIGDFSFRYHDHSTKGGLQA